MESLFKYKELTDFQKTLYLEHQVKTLLADAKLKNSIISDLRDEVSKLSIYRDQTDKMSRQKSHIVKLTDKRDLLFKENQRMKKELRQYGKY